MQSTPYSILAGHAGNVNKDEDVAAHKRARKEAKGMEPTGHGNAPATGTHLEGFVDRYLPCNFPDKLTLKQKYCNTHVIRNVATAGTLAGAQYILFNTNSLFSVFGTTGQVINGFSTGHQPNQRDNWTSQYGYYRVVEFEYKLHCVNVTTLTTVQTATPAFANAIVNGDAILTLMKTQQVTDFSSTSNAALWEQKLAHNHVLPARVGNGNPSHTFHGTVCPEDYDIDPVTTAGDETWTAIGSNPSQSRFLGLSVAPLLPYVTAGTLPEVGVAVFVEIVMTVQYAGYLPSLRQAIS